jgi:hypothetical protein
MRRAALAITCCIGLLVAPLAMKRELPRDSEALVDYLAGLR